MATWRSVKYLPVRTLLNTTSRRATSTQGRRDTWFAWKQPKVRETDPEVLKAQLDPGWHLGDYPILPRISATELPPTGWWDNQDRRNKDTPIHEDDDALNIWMYDFVYYNNKYTDHQLTLDLFIGMGMLFGLLYLAHILEPSFRHPAVPQQYPYNNLYLERGGDPDKMPTQTIVD